MLTFSDAGKSTALTKHEVGKDIQEETMTVTGPDFVALQVRDVERAAQFYETHLGLKRTPAAPPGAVVFATSPIAFAVRETVPGVDLDAVTQPGAGVVLWLHSNDPEELHRSLAESGTPILRGLEPSPFGLNFTFQDPDGYAVTVHGNR